MLKEFQPVLDHLPEVMVKQFQGFWQEFSGLAPMKELREYPLFLQTAPKVIGASNFIRQLCHVQPQLLKELFASQYMTRGCNKHYYQSQVAQVLAHSQDQSQLAQGLRKLRQREMMRIAWRDIAGWATLTETLHELTVFADIVIAQTCQQLLQWRSQVYGEPKDKQGQPAELMTIALGKLGGCELNFSSDVDLMFAYTDSGQTDGKRSISNEQFFSYVVRDLVSTLNDVTQDGFVFRVDLRLRPYGESGPLVITLNALETYYQLQGREWERYALVKARVISGDSRHQQLLRSIISPFVYRRYVDYSVISALRELKQLLDRETRRLSLHDNIKRGPGGIREIEFVVQAIQIIRGGKDSYLQTTNLLTALNYIQLIDELPAVLTQELKQAYIFLRNLENRMQMLNDRQSQQLPQQADNQAKLSCMMNFPDWTQLLTALEGHRKKAKQHFDNTITSRSEQLPTSLHLVKLQDLMRPTITDEQCLQLIESMPEITAPQDCHELVKQLRNSACWKAASPKARERLTQFIPQLLDKIICRHYNMNTLRRLIPIVEAIAKRSVYIMLLLENPLALEQLVQYCAASGWIAAKIAQQPLLLDDLLLTHKTKPTISQVNLQEELRHILLAIPKDDLESQMESLRQFKGTHEMRAAIYDIEQLLTVTEVNDYLTKVAIVIIEQAFQLAAHLMIGKYGYPNDNEGKESSLPFLILAYGKLGSSELTYESDLDLVFLHGGDGHQLVPGSTRMTQGEFYVRLAQRMINILNVRTMGGVLYEVDVRLRPSGSAGLLVSHIESYQQYQRNKAWTWEHQALVRAKAILGAPALAQQFEQLRKTLLMQVREPIALQQDIVAMRKKMLENQSVKKTVDMKKDAGGLTDIEFLVQYGVLRWAADYPDLAAVRHHLDGIRALLRHGLLSPQDSADLEAAYHYYGVVLHHQTLQSQSEFSLQKWQAFSNKVLKIWDKIFNQ